MVIGLVWPTINLSQLLFLADNDIMYKDIFIFTRIYIFIFC